MQTQIDDLISAVAERRGLSAKRANLPGEAKDVTRIEFENIEAVVRGNRERLIRVEARLEALSHEVAELTKAIRSLRSDK